MAYPYYGTQAWGDSLGWGI